jgi:serine phosphatase RsbU (regulator of sigma subunit)
MDADGQLFGMMRLEAAVAASADAGAGARQLVEEVIAAVRGFAGPGFQSDDIAIVVVKRWASKGISTRFSEVKRLKN